MAVSSTVKYFSFHVLFVCLANTLFIKLYDFKCLLNGFASLLYLHELYNLKINEELNSVTMILQGIQNV
jgi:hypothetical protein